MSTVEERRIGAVLGAFVADAAAQPLHWNYDLQKLEGLLGDKEDIEFREVSTNPYYTLNTGRNSCYGDQAFCLLQSLVECNGLDTRNLKDQYCKMFGPGSEYDSSAVDGYIKGVVKKNYPVKGPWMNSSIKQFLKNMEEGKTYPGSETDEQMDGVAKVAPLVALYAGHKELLEKVEDAIRVTQDNDIAVVVASAAARILEQFILHGPDPEAVTRVAQELRKPNHSNPLDLDNGMAGLLRQVLDVKDKDHKEVACSVFRND